MRYLVAAILGGLWGSLCVADVVTFKNVFVALSGGMMIGYINAQIWKKL